MSPKFKILTKQSETESEELVIPGWVGYDEAANQWKLNHPGKKPHIKYALDQNTRAKTTVVKELIDVNRGVE